MALAHLRTFASEFRICAYFDFDDLSAPRTLMISADISGRQHYDCDAEVISLLEQLKAAVEGNISNAP